MNKSAVLGHVGHWTLTEYQQLPEEGRGCGILWEPLREGGRPWPPPALARDHPALGPSRDLSTAGAGPVSTGQAVDGPPAAVQGGGAGLTLHGPQPDLLAAARPPGRAVAAAAQEHVTPGRGTDEGKVSHCNLVIVSPGNNNKITMGLCFG